MSKESDKKGKPEVTPSGLPLLYNRPTPLDAIRHLHASIKSNRDFSFARATNSLPLNTIEFIDAAKTYPIVFTNSEMILPVAIVGLEQENYFVQKDNRWKENAYVPAYLRQYPFIFFEEAKEKKFYLCVDEASSSFSPKTVAGSNRLYTNDGNPSDFTNNVLKFCTNFYQHHLITRNFCADLVLYKLLQPYQSEVVLPSGKKTKLSGFQMIDEKALNELPNKDYLALRDKGWIPFIYLALASTSNRKSLAPEK